MLCINFVKNPEDTIVFQSTLENHEQVYKVHEPEASEALQLVCLTKDFA